MNALVPTIVAISIVSGQFIKIPFGNLAEISIIDFSIILLSLFGLLKLRFKLKKPPTHLKTALIFILITILSLALSSLSLTFNEYLNSFLYIVRLFFYILFAEIIYSEAYTNFSSQINQVLMISGVGLAFAGLLQILIFPNLIFLASLGWDPHYFRLVSTFLDPNFIGAFFVLTLLILFQNYTLPRKWFVLIFALIYLVLLLTFSRSSYAMFLVSFVTLSLLQKSIKLLIISVLLFGLLMAGFNIYTKVISTPRNIDRTQSASFRLNTWQQGLTIFQQFPILGVGFNAYRYGIEELNLGNEQFIKSHGSSSNDSSILFVASTTGIIGLIFYALFLLSIFKISFSKNPVLFSSLVGLLIHSVFANSLFYPPIFLWILLTSISSKK